MRIDLYSGETRPYVPNVTAKLDHSPGNAGYEGRSSRGRVDYSGLREIEPSQLRSLNKMTNDCRRSEIGRLFSPQGRVDKQGVERADPVVPLVNIEKGEHLREICRRFREFRAGLRKAVQQRQGEREPRTGLQLLDGIERCLDASDRRPERGSHVICGGYRRLVAFCSARHIPPRSNSSACAAIRTQQKLCFTRNATRCLTREMLVPRIASDGVEGVNEHLRRAIAFNIKNGARKWLESVASSPRSNLRPLADVMYRPAYKLSERFG